MCRAVVGKLVADLEKKNKNEAAAAETAVDIYMGVGEQR